MKGYDTSRIVGMSINELNEVTCGICLGIFNEPVVTQCCRQMYCKECIDGWLTSNSTCPNDRKTLRRNDLSSVPRFIDNLLMNMQIKCEYEENGCNAIVKISEIGYHTDTCAFSKCITCGLKTSNARAHDCVTELIILNKRLSDKLKILSNEMIPGAAHIFQKARSALGNFDIESYLKLTSSECRLLVELSKRAIVENNTYADLSRNLCQRLNTEANLFNDGKKWMVMAFTENGGESLVYSDKYFRIRFSGLVIELFTPGRY